MMRTINQAVAIAAILIAISPVATAAVPQTTDLTNTFRGAGAVVDRLQVYEIAGIVIIRGRAADKAMIGRRGYIRTVRLNAWLGVTVARQ